jgi:hypothetical protein
LGNSPILTDTASKGNRLRHMGRKNIENQAVFRFFSGFSGAIISKKRRQKRETTIEKRTGNLDRQPSG